MKQNPTIGIFTKQLDNWTSGSGHHLNEMIKNVLALNTKLRFIFIHYKSSQNPIYKHADGEMIIPRNPFKSAAVLRRHHFDVLHFTPLTFFAPIWGTPGKKMATIHGIEQLLVPQFYGRLEMLHERYLVPLYARKMDHIITVSQASKDFFISDYRVKPENITVCPNAVNSTYQLLPETDRQLPERLLTANDIFLKHDERFVFHISRFSERKNPWTILKGYAEFSSRPAGKNTKLIIAGGRWHNDRVENKLKQLGIKEKVILAGFVEEREAVRLYNSATAFVFPSLAEGFGMPNIEAMACGCPVITSGIFAIPEVVGDAALIISEPDNHRDLADKLELLFNNENLRQKMIEKGLQHAEKYKSWEPSARKMLEVYENLAGV